METLASNSFHLFTGKLKGFVYKRVKDYAVAEDIVQDVYLKVQSKIGQLQDDEKLTGWIYKITRNTIMDYYRNQSKTFHADDLDWESDHNDMNDCVQHCLKEMVLTLPLKYREAIELTELENLSQLQLAEKLGISYSGAKSRVQRARQMLKDKMEATYKIEMDAYGNVVVCENKVPCNCAQA